jgi:hypothetical protein
MSMANRLDEYAVSVTIPLNPMEPWMATIIGIKLDNTVDQMAQVALTSLCGSRLSDTAMTPIALYPIHCRGDHMWQQRLEAVSDPEGPHFHVGMAAMAEYEQYSFDLLHTLTGTVIQQRLSLAAYDVHISDFSRELAQLNNHNDLLHGGTVPPSNQKHELVVAYHRLSEAEQGWNHTHQLLDVAHEMVDKRTHVIIHLEQTNEQQDLKLEERAAVIVSLEQYVQVLQLQVPPTPVALVEPDAVSDVDEE